MAAAKRSSSSSSSSTAWDAVREEVLSRTDVEWAYREFGVELSGRPNSAGWVSVEGDTSARVNVGAGAARGRYRDFGGSGERGSLFDFAISRGKFPAGEEGYKAALKYYAEAAGVELPSRIKIKRAADHFDWQPWNDNLVRAFCEHKQPISPSAVRAAGGRLAMYPRKVKSNSVIMFPVWGPHLLDADPVAWAGLARGVVRDVKIWQGPDKVARAAKTVTKKDEGGPEMVWVGDVNVEAMAEAEFVWKTEGLSDMLALMTALESLPEEERKKHAIVTNPDGCHTPPNEHHVASVAGKIVYVVHDADCPGQGLPVPGEDGRMRPAVGGAPVWCEGMATAAKEVRNVKLPFEIEEKHGKDLRDYLIEGGTFSSLLDLARAGELTKRPAEPAAEVLARQAIADIEARYRQICADVGIEVIGEWGNGNVELYSRYHGKTQRIDRFSKVRFDDIKAFCGPPGELHITSGAADSPGMHRLATVRSAVLFLAGYKEMTEDCFTGLGCHRGKDRQNRETDEIVVVNADEIAVCGGCDSETNACQFDVLREPNRGGHYFHLSKTPGWCDFAALKEFVECARDASWRTEALMAAEHEFARWHWYQSSSPQLMAGLAAATFIQGLWRWRPQVAVTGKSNAGKSYLFETIEHLFSGLAVNLSADSTPKGVLQEIGKLNKILIIDEWDKTPHKDQVLSILRNAGRGKSFRATGQPSQTARKTGVKVIGWIAGITSNATEEADWNRFITAELLPARAGEAGKLVIAPEEELRELGHKLLAIALVCGLPAVALAERLKGVQVEGVHARLVESYAVPAAMIACGVGGTAGEVEERAEGLLRGFLECLDHTSDSRTDEQQLFDVILRANIDAGRRLGRRTVQTLIEIVLGKRPSVNVGYDDALEADPHLRQVGMAVDKDRGALAIFPDTVSAAILRGTRFESTNLATMLRRTTGGPAEQSKILGRNHRMYFIPLSVVGLEAAKQEDF